MKINNTGLLTFLLLFSAPALAHNEVVVIPMAGDEASAF